MPSDKDLFRVGPYWLSQRPDGRSDTWYITWHDPGIGTARRKSTRTSDLEAAKGILTQHYLESTRKPKETPQEAYVGMIMADYLEHHAAHIPGAEMAMLSIKHFMAFLEREQSAGRIIGAAKVSDITPPLIRRFISWRKGAHEYTYEDDRGEKIAFQSKGVKGSSISRNLSDVRAAFNMAVKDGALTAAPLIPDVSTHDKSPPRDRVLTQREFAALLDAAPDHLFKFLMLAFCTAGRPGAILELGPANTDLENNLIDLNQKDRGRTKKRRPALPIAKALRLWLIGCQGDTYVAYDWRGRQLTNGEKKPRPVASIKKAFRTARAEAGLGADVIPYTIRHTVATELRKRGVPQWEVAAFLGHSAMSTTDQYAKYDVTYLQRAVDAIDAYFEELKAHTTRHVRDMTGVVDLSSNHFRTTREKSASK